MRYINVISALLLTSLLSACNSNTSSVNSDTLLSSISANNLVKLDAPFNTDSALSELDNKRKKQLSPNDGSYVFTENSLDIATTDGSFLAVSKNTENPTLADMLFTKSVSLTFDEASGMLTDENGYYLVDSLNVGTIFLDENIKPTTENIKIALNFYADDKYYSPSDFSPNKPDTYNNSGSMNIFDSLGERHLLSYYFIRPTAGSYVNFNHIVVFFLLDDKPVNIMNLSSPNSSATTDSGVAYSHGFDLNGDGTDDRAEGAVLLDINNDGVPEGYDINGDGIINAAEEGVGLALRRDENTGEVVQTGAVLTFNENGRLVSTLPESIFTQSLGLDDLITTTANDGANILSGSADATQRLNIDFQGSTFLHGMYYFTKEYQDGSLSNQHEFTVIDYEISNHPVKTTIVKPVINLQAWTNSTLNPINFDPSNPSSYHYGISAEVYDSLGGEHALSIYFLKLADTLENHDVNWAVFYTVDGEKVNASNDMEGITEMAKKDTDHDGWLTKTELSSGKEEVVYALNHTTYSPYIGSLLRFYLSGLPIKTPLITLQDLSFDDPSTEPRNDGAAILNAGSASQKIMINLEEITQFASSFEVISLAQNGHVWRWFKEVQSTTEGEFIYSSSDGNSTTLGRASIFSFDDLATLEHDSSHYWHLKNDSDSSVRIDQSSVESIRTNTLYQYPEHDKININ